ncbi:hypothetical protein N7537_005579 [Penicillium hordei]|uniref:Tse2 ADP-ribosyltransferase toxin domain-containing protein n=1 Tax=Penicillium hordei TaxID=40994 RepID=A0AAD6E600_9EURO|nr:uncharacterized protein N7537_005579 [Penicillium hordei]KAJ5602623.1 hypothetical protein N7537_005579 [Penicillium hordei]
MFPNILRHVQAPVLSISRLPNRCLFSYVSAHSAFPASLYRFQIHRDSRLYDKAFEQYGREAEDGVEVNADGLVYPSRTVKCSNGALFMPNTHLMQKVTRMSNDYYLEEVESGKAAAEAHYLCIPKGTTIPNSLILFREHTSRFSLQPAHAMSLDSFNSLLTRFYLEFGRTFNPDAWLERNPYHDAFSDEEEEWMDY